MSSIKLLLLKEETVIIDIKEKKNIDQMSLTEKEI